LDSALIFEGLLPQKTRPLMAMLLWWIPNGNVAMATLWKHNHQVDTKWQCCYGNIAETLPSSAMFCSTGQVEM